VDPSGLPELAGIHPANPLSFGVLPLRLVFMGTPELARTVLVALGEDLRFEVVAVVAQPDKPTGRGLHLTPPPAKVEALARGLPVLQPLKARDPAFLAQLRAFAPDLIVVAAYGQILPQTLLDIPRHGCVNVHTSILPRWRGAAPIQWAIAEGDLETGVTIMRMEAGLDTGPMIAVTRTPIGDNDTSVTLHDRLAQLGAKLLLKTLPPYVAGELVPQPQPAEGVTYARKITKDDGRLDWSLPAPRLWQRLRAFTPWPGVFCQLPAEPRPKLLKIHQAVPWPDEPSAASSPAKALALRPGDVLAPDHSKILVVCGTGVLQLLEVQLEGGRRMNAVEFLAGHSLTRLE